jgi:hypothetical protein
MSCRRGMFLAVFLYVALDLSVPAIPGAFVFESADSVEISSGRAWQGKAEIFVLPALSRDSFDLSQPPLDLRDRLAANGNVALSGHPILNRLPRATLDPAPPSEDPH